MTFGQKLWLDLLKIDEAHKASNAKHQTDHKARQAGYNALYEVYGGCTSEEAKEIFRTELQATTKARFRDEAIWSDAYELTHNSLHRNWSRRLAHKRKYFIGRMSRPAVLVRFNGILDEISVDMNGFELNQLREIRESLRPFVDKLVDELMVKRDICEEPTKQSR